jgi:hypothetical protein
MALNEASTQDMIGQSTSKITNGMETPVSFVYFDVFSFFTYITLLSAYSSENCFM